MTSREIRNSFLNFFESKGHKIVPSSPIVVKNDPTLMFTNAGMNQFKDFFLGNQKTDMKRAADTQKCLRVSGKHNDLEEVGVDTYHHTMFEMLGNWSFGDYFKKEAIEWSWQLLTEVLQVPKDRLYVTIFEGDDKEKLPLDIDSYNFWKLHIAEDRILKGNKKDNFWEMGDTGPCGPCTEIHIDSRSDEERSTVDGKTLVNKDHPQVIEIWNNVFMQFNRQKDGALQPLPDMHVDTGMGFERLVRVIQGKNSNYDTDIFMPLIRYVEDTSKKQYSFGDTKQDIAFRVIADHIRAVAFCIADGQMPSNNGAGYVVRRILRRAVRYGYSYLGYTQPFFFGLVDVLAEQFEGVFDELSKQKDFVKKAILEEEKSFFNTLSDGIKKMNSLIDTAQNSMISGKDAFELYDTYGFPIDLTRLIAQEHHLQVDDKTFEDELTIQKNRSREATKVETFDWVEVRPSSSLPIFLGYDQSESISKIVKYRKIHTKNKELFQVVLDQTPFYAESGGQVGDSGSITANGESIEVINTVKENDLIIHLVERKPKELACDFTASVAVAKRQSTTKNHSATHLLQAALRQVLGSHIEQKGSLVNDQYLRFDFSHFSKMTDEDIVKVEQIVNEKIKLGIALQEDRNVPIKEALERGVTALFGEKYGEYVRVITFDPLYSQELCGGTHVKNTSEIGYLKILSEASISSGVRRIEAITGDEVLAYYQMKASELKSISDLMKNPQKLYASIQSLQEENQKMRKQVEDFTKRFVDSEIVRLESMITDQKLVQKVEGYNGEIAKSIASYFRQKYCDATIALGYEENHKAMIALAVGDEALAKGKKEANTIIKEISPMIQGGGGGQKTFATAGGTNLKGIEDALNYIQSM